VRVVIITGAGDKAISTGGDIIGFAGMADMHPRREFMKATMDGFGAIENSPLPVIAAVNGWALGGGCELTFACDIVIAADTAQFGMPEASVGLVPGFGVLRGPSVIGRQWAKFMVFAGERIGAEEALRLGMVQRVVPADQLLSTAIELAHRVAAQAPIAISLGKQLIGRGVDRGEAHYAVETLAVLFSTRDAAEGFAAFSERRRPLFEGR
jgi:enoyl-CoA hydratase